MRNDKQAASPDTSARYAVIALARDGSTGWYVVDRRGVQRTKELGPGAQGLREAAWLARLLNDRDKARDSASPAARR